MLDLVGRESGLVIPLFVQPDHEVDPVLLEDENVAKIAAKNKKTSAQVLIRFAVERGVKNLSYFMNS